MRADHSIGSIITELVEGSWPDQVKRLHHRPVGVQVGVLPWQLGRAVGFAPTVGFFAMISLP